MDFLDQIKIDPAQEARIVQCKHYGDDWVRRHLRAAKARAYIEQQLLVTDSKTTRCGRCCSEGTITFARKDSQPISDDDVTAILTVDRGQENRVTAREALQVTIYWLLDSSD